MKRPSVLLANLTAVTLLGAAPLHGAPNMEWFDLYDGGGWYTDVGTTAVADELGNLVVGGECFDAVEGSDILIRKLDRESGSPVWTTSYSAFDGNDMALTGMVWDGSGDLLVGGYIRGCDT